MKVAVMLRHLDQHGGGVAIYTSKMVEELLKLGNDHEFVLIYQSARHLGTFGVGPHIREAVVKVPSRFLWDQAAVPWIEHAHKPDLIFNPKYSLPLAARSLTTFVCHGLDWYVMPHGSKVADQLSHRFLMPRYARKADAIITVSDTVRQHVISYWPVEPERVHAVPLGVGDVFREPVPATQVEDVCRSYGLPERFFLYVGQIYPPKNFGRLLRAYARVGPKLGLHLVVAGEHRWLCEDDLALIEQLGIASWVVRAGWVGHDHLPAFYAMAEALLLPSLYEGFGLPILEAMAVGCPVVTANRYATKEVAGSAAVLVDPEDVEAIARGMHQVATDRALRAQLVVAGRARSQSFSWSACAKATLRVLESVAHARSRPQPAGISAVPHDTQAPAATPAPPAADGVGATNWNYLEMRK